MRHTIPRLRNTLWAKNVRVGKHFYEHVSTGSCVGAVWQYTKELVRCVVRRLVPAELKRTFGNARIV
ncbi:uncharacterized protein PHALS_09589 [Plasmopara halstedii]|uniref:Uncharacterized protein n=1 Tax=Plasmopara halstedii TaxID=4781 RepID=A0A0P1AF80_PLAHL|nr:uncharacterized protein PHALS_09589 [Plasmopara halstedii]CEG39335.1 hypothetical protein PHALS_09589 [Plasmopara halstedii]|eukprot:XP_024575704.1 hypothetical protein PHALS_09589 [Plasmopara halstedii]